MVSTRLTEFAWSEEDEYRETILQLPELMHRNWTGWAWYKILPTWIEAQPVKSVDGISDEKRTHLLLLKHAPSGKILCVYPVSTSSGTSTLTRVGADFVLRARRIDPEQDARVAAVIGVAESSREVHRLMESCVAQARSFVSGTPRDQLVPFDEGDWREGPSGGIGFCTWSSLGEDIHPTYDNMSNLLGKLASSGITIQSFILDDGWHSQKTYASGDASPYRCKTGPEDEKGIWQLRGLTAFEANEALHPDGLGGCVADVKRKLGDQCEVGVWLALTGGYWDGIHPDSPLIAKYNCRRYNTSRDRLPGTPNVPFTPAYIPGGRGHMWLPPPETALQYWRDWFAYIRSSGATFLKVDVQGSLGILDGVEGAACQYALWQTMVQASDEVFGEGRIIHCMSQHESMHGGVQGLGILTKGRKFVWRNSDDYGLVGKKDDPQQQHIFTNLTNSLLTNHLSLIPDPDMFMTADQAPLYHALLRVLYPGPLLLSDRPGEHDLELIGRMSAKDASGTSRVLRTTDYARPLASRILDTSLIGMVEGKGLWAASKVGEGAILGVWNVHNDAAGTKVVDKLHSDDIEDALDSPIDGTYMIVESDLRSGEIKRSALVSAQMSLEWDVTLGPLECAAYWVTPVFDFGKTQIAVLGLSDKLAGLAAVSHVSVEGECLEIRCGYQGRLTLAVLGATDVEVFVNGRAAETDVIALPGLEGSLVRVDLGLEDASSSCWIATVRSRS